MSTPDTLQKIDLGLSEAESIIPTLSPILSLIPGFGMIVPFLGLIPVCINAVETIMKATGTSKTAAITAVMSHLTPGMPNAPALSQGGGTAAAQANLA